MIDDDDQDARDYVRHLFRSARESVPADVVPSSGLTREDLLRQNDAAGTWVAVTTPGELLFDPDGMPIGVGEAETVPTNVGSTTVTRAQLEQLGLTEQEVPNVHILG